MSHIESEFHTIENQRQWLSLFQKLSIDQGVRTEDKKCDIALLPSNRGLNRFRDVLPYDHSRVCLKEGSTDYINANYVHVPLANRKYILTQGPLQSTTNHFWQMVWQENSRVIVMLTRLVEKGCSKCWLYYPDYENEEDLHFDDIHLKVTFQSEKQHRHFTERRFQLSHLLTGESRSIIHWSDFEWPDHGAPKSAEPFLQLLRDVRHSGAFDPHYGAPILHCSAGIGRSGTFVLVDSMLKLLAHQENPSDISLIDVLAHIRTQRPGLVQTAEQLRFSYQAIVAGFQILDEMEKSEKAFSECDANSSGESDNDDQENDHSCRTHPRGCDRQNNIMPNDPLNGHPEDINCELMRRLDSTASHYQPSPKTTRRLISLSELRSKSEDAKDECLPSSTLTTHDEDMSLRRRGEHVSPGELIDDGSNDARTHPNDPLMIFHALSPATEAPEAFSLYLFTRKYRRPFLMGLLTLCTGLFLLSKFAFRRTYDY